MLYSMLEFLSGALIGGSGMRKGGGRRGVERWACFDFSRSFFLLLIQQRYKFMI